MQLSHSSFSLFFFFKQKTAYELRISDWSSDGCSSDLFELRLVYSVALARTREALHNGWDKNDSKDAQEILHMLRIGATQRYVDPLAAGINDLQEMSKTHEAISKAKTQTWYRILTHYLPLYFPEIERFAGNSRSDWFLAFIGSRSAEHTS